MIQRILKFKLLNITIIMINISIRTFLLLLDLTHSTLYVRLVRKWLIKIEHTQKKSKYISTLTNISNFIWQWNNLTEKRFNGAECSNYFKEWITRLCSRIAKLKELGNNLVGFINWFIEANHIRDKYQQ